MLASILPWAFAVLLSAPAPSPTIYYCASGNTVKYHATDRCWGLRHCNAVIKKRTLAEAQKRHQAPCRVCY